MGDDDKDMTHDATYRWLATVLDGGAVHKIGSPDRDLTLPSILRCCGSLEIVVVKNFEGKFLAVGRIHHDIEPVGYSLHKEFRDYNAAVMYAVMKQGQS